MLHLPIIFEILVVCVGSGDKHTNQLSCLFCNLATIALVCLVSQILNISLIGWVFSGHSHATKRELDKVGGAVGEAFCSSMSTTEILRCTFIDVTSIMLSMIMAVPLIYPQTHHESLGICM